jgi:hypothetical protein
VTDSNDQLVVEKIVYDIENYETMNTSAKPETGCERREPASAAQPRQPSQPQSQLGETRKRLSADNSQIINF